MLPKANYLEDQKPLVIRNYILLLHSLLVRGCDFQHDGPQIDLGSTLKKAVVMGNIFTVGLNYSKNG